MKTLTLKHFFVPSLALIPMVVFVAAKPAQAYTFNDVITIETTFNKTPSVVDQMPWNDNETLAREYAEKVRGGTKFAFRVENLKDVQGKPTGLRAVRWASWDGKGVVVKFTLDNVVDKYALIPAAVPEPLTILGSITAAGFGVAFKRKKNSTKEE